MWPMAGLLIGLILGVFAQITVPVFLTKYITVIILVGLDSIFKGVVDNKENKFRIMSFVEMFLFNIILGLFLVYLGEKLSIDLSIAVYVVFGIRLFNNFSEIRKYLLKFKKKNVIIEK